MAFGAGSAAAAVTPNPWLENRFLHIAHQGGEDEAPSNTMYALKSSVNEAHADMIEIDVHLTEDGQLVVLHDDTYTRTACLPALCPGPNASTELQRPDSQIRDMTLAEVKALDAGYWFRPGTYAHDYSLADSAYPFRGIRTGAKAPPKGYTAEDFRIPTLAEVLAAFPYTPINIEIKMPKSYDPPNPYDENCGNGDGMPPGDLCDDLDLAMPITKALAEGPERHLPQGDRQAEEEVQALQVRRQSQEAAAPPPQNARSRSSACATTSSPSPSPRTRWSSSPRSPPR